MNNAVSSHVDTTIRWLQRTLLLWLALTSWVALKWTDWFPGAIDPFSKDFFTNTHLNISIAVTMFSVGMLLPSIEIRQVFERWPTVLLGTLIQYASMPVLAFVVAWLWGFDGPELIGVILVGCVPGAMASNVLTMNARGNTSYSVSLTTSATLLSPVAVPLALWITLSWHDKATSNNLLHACLFLLLTVVVPVIGGHLFGRAFSNHRMALQRVGTVAANVIILLIIAAVVGRTRTQLADFEWRLVWALLALNIAGYAIGYLGGALFRLSEPMRRALTLEVGMQNAGVGTALAFKLFSDETAIAPAIYTFGCMLTGTILSLVWSLVPVRASDDSHEPPGNESASAAKETS